jgi:signal transduction histidine kinase
MLEMINGSLNLYKMETGSYDYHPQKLDLLQVVRKVFAECYNLSAAHEISLNLLLDGQPPADDDEFSVRAEESLSHSMLSNLIKNAVEASPAGSRVDVSLSYVSGIPTIHIRNEGEVPENIRERFFDKYAGRVYCSR